MQAGVSAKLEMQRHEKSRRLLPGLTVNEGFMRHPFDLEHGVRTSGLIAGRHLATGHRHDRHATAYYGVAPSVLHALIRRWQRSQPAAPLGDFTFVDVGAGMGRAVLLAAELPFRAALGVELHPTLARIARRNAAIWRASGRARAPMRFSCRDAASFHFPKGPCLVFLFNPFGPVVMRRVLRSLASAFAARPGQLDLIYVNNEQEGILEQQSGFVRLFLGRIRRSPADAKADRAILNNQPDGEYAAFDYEDCSIWRWMGARPGPSSS